MSEYSLGCWALFAATFIRFRPLVSSHLAGLAVFHGMLIALYYTNASALVSTIAFINAAVWPWTLVCCSKYTRPGAFALLGSVACVGMACFAIPIIEIHEL